MFGLKKLERHENLVTGMADARGVDLGEALMRGDLSANELRSAIFRCTACARPEDCAHWQADHPQGADHTPDYCRNSAMFARLAAE